MVTRSRFSFGVCVGVACCLWVSVPGAEEPDGIRLNEPPYASAAWWATPEHSHAKTTAGLSVNTQSRAAVVSFYNNYYTPTLSVPIEWTGSVAGCVAGTTSQAYLDATIQLVNFYRAMTGLPGDVVDYTSVEDECQEAALMMYAQGSLSHSPPPTWACYTSGGATAAGNSNLALGIAGPGAVVAYMRDSGSYNYKAGHRRWILYPPQVQIGTGSTYGSNALWVLGPFGSRPALPDVVAWPPEGYVPYQLVYPRWSMSLNSAPTASYASATVTMTNGGTPITVDVVSRTDNGYGDNTIVWEPGSLSIGAGQPDQTIRVTVSNIMVGGTPRSRTYDVIIIDPALTPELIFDDGFESGGTGAWSATEP